MSRAAKLYARISPTLANRPGSRLFSKTHARLIRASSGRMRRFLGADTLLLRTVGRKTGRTRENPLMYVRHQDAFAVVPSNAAADTPPAWWLNLQARPEAEALVDGGWRAVRAREATAAEHGDLWPRLVAMYEGYEHYASITDRELPVVVLEPR